MGLGVLLGVAHLRRSLGEQPPMRPSLDQARNEFTRNYLRQLLELANGNISRAAQSRKRSASRSAIST